MAKTEVQRCMDWLCKQQGEMESAPFGQGKLGVLEALATQQSKVKDIMKFQGDVDAVLKSEKLDENSAKQLNGHLHSVKALSDKRDNCLDVVRQIASLEDLVQNLSGEFDHRAVHLVNTLDSTDLKGGPSQSNESLARTAQHCITSVRQNWRWIFQVMQCAEVHLRNAAAYQEYFQEADEAEYWMNTTLSRIHLSFDRRKLTGDKVDADQMIAEIKDVLAAYLQWQTKIDYLYDRAKEVVPVPLRVTDVKEPKPIIALTDFSAPGIDLIEGETLTLLDNTDRKKWKVKNAKGQVGIVPSVILLIPSPCGPALDVAVKLRLQLLSLWTSSVKRLGYQMIAFMLLVFRDWTEEEVALLQKMAATDKDELLKTCNYIEGTLVEQWNGYGDFEELQERITRLKMIIEDAPEMNGNGSGNNTNEKFSSGVVVQVKSLEELTKKYKDFWTYWETYKCVAEMLRQPKFMLVCDKWEQLRFITSAHFVKFWDTQLDVSSNDLTKSQQSMILNKGKNINDNSNNNNNMDGIDGSKMDEMILSSSTSVNYAEKPREEVSSEVTIEEEKEETTTDTVTSTLEEEQHTYVIKGVLDPRDDKTPLSLQNAIMLGIIDQANNRYINPDTGKSIPMADAMNEGRIMMEIVSRKKIREEKNSYGLITIKITKESRPYTITGVLDPTTDMKLSVTEAADKKILDVNKSTYRTENGEMLSIADAIHSGLVLVDYHEGEAHHQPEVVTKTYAVHGVVDQKKKRKVSFSDAVRDGLLDKDTGEYVNNVTGSHTGVHDAIMKGFIKARIVTDPSKLEINPENQIIVEKLASLRSKMKAVEAFKFLKK